MSERYHADGVTIARGVFGAPAIAELDAEAVRLFARKDLIDSDNIRCRWSNNAETGECRFDCSAPNRSDQWRRLLYLSYNAISDGGERRDAHYAEFKGWLHDRYAEYGKTSTFFR